MVVGGAVVLVSVLVLGVSALGGVPGGPRVLGAYVDASVEANLPTWWSTAVFTAAALAHGVAALTARSAGVRGAGWWAAGAVLVAGLSLAEHTGVHERVLAAEPLLLGVAVTGAFAVVALGLGGRAGVLVGVGAVLVVGSAVVGGAVGGGTAVPAGGLAHLVVVHLAELGEIVGGLVLLAAAASRIGVERTGGALAVGHRGRPVLPGRPVTARAIGGGVLVVCLVLSVLSAAVVLLAPAAPARPFLDVLIEDNLPSWWSAALLLTAALAHATVAVVRRAAGVEALTWAVSALVLTALSLDDHTRLHERSEAIGRWLVTPGSYPFLWLIPGAVAGLAVAAVMVALARRSPERTRWLLVAGIGLLLLCALGLEAVQGLFMQNEDEGTAFVLLYHLEELGENLAALLLLSAAGAALTVQRAEVVRVAPLLSVHDRTAMVRRSPVGQEPARFSS